MLKRKAYRLFESWLEAPSMKALLVMGARQVGKSYLVDAFCSDHFENVVKFDLIENADIRDSFSAAKSADDLELRMSVAATSPLVPNKTAIIIDEVQECPNIVT
ncbi:MAG: AAA family ATPase, partial [Olsenella sp.]|nr:AAA family ATPase [Olsenella sp.]